MGAEEVALSRVEEQIEARGYKVIRRPRNYKYGDLLAYKSGREVRVEVKGLASRNGIWLKRRQVEVVDIMVIYIVDEKNVWVLSPKDALFLLNVYQTDFIARKGYPPAAEGFNKSQFPHPTGWVPLDKLL
ncbi:MAG: hypothetical protein DWB56_10250 [Candidatus Jettenia sp.]|uniref:Endonuclease n=1 Tax=Candidatus Jettenia caeni TaxID=247490 RepID=I3IL07_9BACT|nr:hypothetical protein [Candidatus Jettenia sp. AMX1]MBC6929325.1 hypothetical protein [Candidatus Jettenia sp.]NUN22731.1 hypothetical protein [Candidatus Jettenia caeni]KAA0249662.1 MAG: hypothetical protein EDM77_07910 [Candidatus Jettenia sp. AMX1]MCE7880762.1 hypothetical protein [Candidatus Jettenia sp. AMX1]MCQ3927556.1 hypothetical protein [Candidatus Jettenia sp.]